VSRTLAIAAAVALTTSAGCYLAHERATRHETDAGTVAPACPTDATREWSVAISLGAAAGGYAMAPDPSCGVHVLVSAEGETGAVAHMQIDAVGALHQTPTGLFGSIGRDALAYHDGALYAAIAGLGTDEGPIGLRLAVERVSGEDWFEEGVDIDGGYGAIAIDAAGVVHMAYALPDGVAHATRAADGSWSRDVIDFRLSAPVTIALDASGATHVSYAWVTAPSVHGAAYATNASGRWETIDLEPIDPLGETGSDTTVLVGPRGVHLLYQAYAEPGVRKIQHALRRPDRSFTFETIDDVGSFGVPTNAGALDADGWLHVVYEGIAPSTDPMSPPIRYATDRSGAFVAETVPAPPGTRAPMITVDASGVVHLLVYQSGRVLHMRRRM